MADEVADPGDVRRGRRRPHLEDAALKHRLLAIPLVAVALVAAVVAASGTFVGSGTGHLHVRTVRHLRTAACVSQDCGPYTSILKWGGVTVAGQTGYYIFLDDTQIDDVTAGPYYFPGIDCGDIHTLGVQAHDASGNTSAIYTIYYTAPACPVGDTTPPTNPSGLSVSGITQTGLTLNWTASTDTGGSGLAGYYANLSGGTKPLQTSLFHNFINLNCGTAYTLGVQAVDNAGNQSNLVTTTGTTSACTSGSPVNTLPPVISGSPTQGSTLTVTNNGTWTGTPTPTFTYQWQRCAGTTCTDINVNGTGSTYTLVAADLGDKVQAIVTGTNTAGADTATSNQIGPISGTGAITCPAVPHTITLSTIDGVTGGTANKVLFGPWTNHLVTTSNGDIYAAYNASNSGGALVAGPLVLARSTDGGATWTHPYTSPEASYHHVDLETDGTNIYMVANDNDASVPTNFTGKLLKFVPGSLGSPTVTKFTDNASSKFSAVYNPATNQIDVGYWSVFPSNFPNFLVLNPATGAVVRSVQIFNTGQDANGIAMQYPNMAVDPAGDIFFGWHTLDTITQNTVQNYYDDEFLYSTDGGITWKGPGGTVTLPTRPTPAGNNYEITNTSDHSEFYFATEMGYTHNWNVMDSLAYNNGALNFMYGGDSPSNHVSYAHLAWPGNTFTDRTHSWTTQDGTVMKDGENSLGAFSQDASHTGTLYFVGANTSSHPVIIDSPNSGTTWCTFATSTQAFSGLTYEGAQRFTDTANNKVEGIFSWTTGTNTADIEFIKAPIP